MSPSADPVTPARSRRARAVVAVVVVAVVVAGAGTWVRWGGGATAPDAGDDTAGPAEPAEHELPSGFVPLDGCGESTERVCTRWPHPFVDRTTGEPIAGNGINLQDAVESDWHYPIARLVQPGSPQFDLVRVALNWPVFEPVAGEFDPAAFAQLDQLVADAGRAGLHVVLDPIHLRRQRAAYWELHPGSTWNMPAWAWEAAGVPVATENRLELDQRYDCAADRVLATSALGYLEEMVRRYAQEPTVIAIDLVNEPRNSCWGLEGQPASGPEAAQQLLDLQLEWVDHLRTIDPDKVFVIEPMYGDFDPALLDLEGFTTRTNLVWTVHDYYSGLGPPYAASGVAAGQRAARYDLDVLDRVSRQEAMAEMISHVVDTMATVGVPVFVGEYGYVVSSPDLAEAFTDKRDLYDRVRVNGTEVSLPRAYWVMNHDQWGFELYVGATRSWIPEAAILTHGRTR